MATKSNGQVAIAATDQLVARMEQLEEQRDSFAMLLSERLIELENASDGWAPYEGLGGGQDGGSEFTRGFLDLIIRQARIYWLKNPLIRRAVNVKAAYVFGLNVNIHATHPDVDAVIQSFLDDPDNRAELFAVPSFLAKEVDLECEGNIFLAFFPDMSTGRLRIRTIPTDEMRDVIRNPEDKREVWYYERQYNQQTFSVDAGLSPPKVITELYPDWRWKPDFGKPGTIGGKKVHWESPVYHIKIGSFSAWKFGVPEVYPAIDWARAYKDELTDDATRSRALARFVWALSTRGSSSAVARAKTKLASTFGTNAGSEREMNPPPVAGSTFIGGEGVELKAESISGAFPPGDHSRPHRLMVASAVGLPDTILSGDPDMGNLATAKTLDRPTELEMTTRRALWHDVLMDIINYLIDLAAIAPSGPLNGTESKDVYGRTFIELEVDSATGEPMDRHVNVDFPPILEHSTLEEIEAIVEAATLSKSGNGVLAGTMPQLVVSRLLLTALGVADIDDVLDQLEEELAAQQARDAEAAAQAAQIARDQALAMQPDTGQNPAGQNPQEKPQAVAPVRKRGGSAPSVQARGAGRPTAGRIRPAESALLEAIQLLRESLMVALVDEEVVSNDENREREERSPDP